MGRFLSSASRAALGVAAASYLLPGQLPTFGAGHVEVLLRSQDWVVPAGAKQVRVRVLAGGGGLIAGGSSSFGAMLSATGGQPAVGAVPGVGGVGTGGDFQASGGPGGANFRGGGGASGSELGNGGAGGAGDGESAGGGGAVGGKNGGAGNDAIGVSGGGASPKEHGTRSTSGGTPARGGVDFSGLGNGTAVYNGLNVPLLHPLFAFLGAGGQGGSTGGVRAGGSGAGGGGGHRSSSPGGLGGACGGGGGGGGTGEGYAGGMCWPADTVSMTGSYDGAQQRVGGGLGGASTRAGAGGGGYARGVFTVEPGAIIPVTVAQAGAATHSHSGGLVIVEY
jgi:hypothetical protein